MVLEYDANGWLILVAAAHMAGVASASADTS